MFDDNHYLLPLRQKLELVQRKEDEELQRMQMILNIADETVKDVVARGATREANFEDLAKAAVVSRNVGFSENKIHGSDSGISNILFSCHLSDAQPVAKTDFDASLRAAVTDLRSISRDSAVSGASTVHQRIAPLRSALSVALKERESSNLRSLAQHANPKTQQRLKNLKNASILFDNLGKIQREHLEPIEKKLTESEFILPFHHPFVVIANHIRNELLAHQTGEGIEDEFNELFNALDRDLRESRKQLDPVVRQQHEEVNENTLPTAKECFITLQTEKEERGELHDRCVLLLEDAKETERQGHEFLAPTTKRVKEQATAALQEVAEKAERVRKYSKEAREQLEQSLSTRESACQEKIDAAASSIAHLEERARVNRNKQEKAVRRMREEIKCLAKLQSEHRSLVKEIGEHHQARVVNEVTLEGLRVACAARSQSLWHAEKACDHSAGIALLVQKQLDSAIAECQAHISRITSQEFSRCSRIAQKTVANCSEWYRCLGDLLSIRSQRMQQIQRRADEGGWQVHFLQKHEVSSQDSAIDELEGLRARIEEIYVPLSRSVLALDVHAATLRYVDQNDPDTKRMREVFLAARDAGRDRLLKEAAKEAADVISARRSRREENASRREFKDFVEHQGFSKQEEEEEEEKWRRRAEQARGANGNTSLSKLMIGSLSSLVGGTVSLCAGSTKQHNQQQQQKHQGGSASVNNGSRSLPSLVNSSPRHEEKTKQIPSPSEIFAMKLPLMTSSLKSGSATQTPQPPPNNTGAPEPPPRVRCSQERGPR